MGELTHMMAKGGPMMYAVLAGAVLTLGLNFILVIVLAFKRRAPAPLFLLMPWLTLALGAAGWAMGMSQLVKAVYHASLEMRDSLTFSGLSIAPLPMWLALTCCAVLFALTAAAAGLTVTIGAGKEAKWQIGGPIGTVLLGALGLAVVTLGALTDRGSAFTLLLPVIGLIAGTGVILVGLRLGKEDKDAQRCAAGRAFVGACALMALGCATVAAQMHGVMMAQQAIASASAEMLQTLMAMGLTSAEHAAKVGGAGLAVMFLAHVIPVMAAREHLFKTFTLISATLSLIAILSIAALHVAVGWWSGTIVDSTMMFRAVEVAEGVPGLPAPAETYSEVPVSHFETVITYSGGRWTREDQPLDQIDAYDPEYVALVATPATTPARSLIEADNLTAGGPELDRYVRVLLRRPPYVDMPDSPYFDWGLLGAVTFEILPLGREPVTPADARKAEVAEEIVDSSSILSLLAGLDDDGKDLFAEPAPGAPGTLLVFDGGKAGNAAQWGVDERSRDIWVAGASLPARSIGTGTSANELLRSLVGEHRPTAVLFVPGEQWTVQDLTDLALYAYDEVQASWDDWSLVCQIDAAAPAPVGDETP